jgi:hypothetical protein
MSFYTKVKQTKKAMIEFLSDHFRYDTMSSWNRSTSYANNVKIHSVIPQKLTSKVYELMEAEGFYEDLNWILSDFNEEHDQQWQAGFNGRSGGYIVLYQGGKKENQHKSWCTTCGQRNFKTVEETNGCKCGRCGNETRKNYTSVRYESFSYPGKSTDQGEDFSDWDIDSLKARVKLVQSFDKMCDAVVAQTIYMAENNTVEEEEYTVTKTRKVIS